MFLQFNNFNWVSVAVSGTYLFNNPPTLNLVVTCFVTYILVRPISYKISHQAEHELSWGDEP